MNEYKGSQKKEKKEYPLRSRVTYIVYSAVPIDIFITRPSQIKSHSAHVVPEQYQSMTTAHRRDTYATENPSDLSCVCAHIMIIFLFGSKWARFLLSGLTYPPCRTGPFVLVSPFLITRLHIACSMRCSWKYVNTAYTKRETFISRPVRKIGSGIVKD